MSRSVCLSKKVADVLLKVGEVRKRVTVLSAVLLEEGCSRSAYHQLQILFAELGSMPDLPCIEGEDGLLRIPDHTVLQ